MQFEHVKEQDDGGGYLRVTAESAAEVVQVAEHFGLFEKPEDVAAAIQKGQLVHESRSGKRFWYLERGLVGEPFLAPYKRLLEKLTGYQGKLPDLDLTGHHPRRLCHTHITQSCQLLNETYRYAVIIQAENWNGKRAYVNATINALDYCEEELGFRKEGQYGIRRNTNYLKRHAPQPGTGCPWLWKVLFQWWMANHATTKQKELLAASSLHRAKNGLRDEEWELRPSGAEQCHLANLGGLYASYDPVKFISWDDFRRAV